MKRTAYMYFITVDPEHLQRWEEETHDVLTAYVLGIKLDGKQLRFTKQQLLDLIAAQTP